MADKRAGISKTELQALVAAEISTALGGDASELQIQRALAMDYYQARAFGNEIDGRSSVVSTDVRDTVEWIMPTLMRIFTGGDQTIEYEPQEERDIPFAKQATEYANYIWNRDNPGFLNFYTLFKDGLLQKNGIGKAWWDDADIPKRERYYGLDDQAFAALVNADDVKVSEHTETEQEISIPGAPDPQTGEPTAQKQKMALHDVVITRNAPGGRVCIAPVPPEYFLISRDGRNIRDARMVGDKVRTTLSELRQEGVDEETLAKIGKGPDADEVTSEEISRNTVEVSTDTPAATTDQTMQPIWKIECYIQADVDGDGIAEMRKVTVAGEGYVLIDDEAWDGARPYFSVTPVVMPHRFWGMSVAELVMDIQLIRSTILRQYLDNLYLSNNQRTEVLEQAIIDPTEILSSRPGGVVRVKAMGSIAPIVVPQIGQAALQGLEYIDQIRENRTGVSERTQGSGANQLHQTAGGERMLMTAAMGKIELIARVFAETGVKDAFRLILQLICRYQQKARVIRLTDKWVPMDPRSWNEDMDVTISVGMGTGDKDQQLQHAMLLGQMQQAVIPLGMATPQNIMATAELVMNAMGLKGPDRFFTLPPPNQGPPPDPVKEAQAQRIQQQTQHDAQAHQGHMAALQQKAQTDAMGMKADAQMGTAKIALDAQAQKQKMAQQAVEAMQQLYLKKYQIDNEIALKAQEMQAQIALKERVADNVHIGGKPG